jgi:hypothetical protein
MATAQAICVCGKCAPGSHVIPLFDGRNADVPPILRGADVQAAWIPPEREHPNADPMSEARPRSSINPR